MNLGFMEIESEEKLFPLASHATLNVQIGIL